MTPSKDLKALGLGDDASSQDVTDAYRELARTAHPDGGGSADGFHELHQHYLGALREIAARPCPQCGGTGKVTDLVGFTTISKICQRCTS